LVTLLVFLIEYARPDSVCFKSFHGAINGSI
jgi:hypothetical protein